MASSREDIDTAALIMNQVIHGPTTDLARYRRAGVEPSQAALAEVQRLMQPQEAGGDSKGLAPLSARISACRAAVSMLERSCGPHHCMLLIARTQLQRALVQMGPDACDPAQLVRIAAAVQATLERLTVPNHPLLPGQLALLAGARLGAGQVAQAREDFRRGYAIARLLARTARPRNDGPTRRPVLICSCFDVNI